MTIFANKYSGLHKNLKLRYCTNCITFNSCTEENFPVLCGNLYFLQMNSLDMPIEDTHTKSTLKQIWVFLFLTLTMPPKYDELGNASFPLLKPFFVTLE